MTELAIETRDLTKRYGRDVLAVDRVELRVGRGEIYGFLGLNGAGKSTTIRMLLGMVRPTVGQARLFGQEVRPEATRLWRRVGYLVESATAYPELTVRENLQVAARLRGIADGTQIRMRIDQLGLAEYADRRAGNLSLGNLQRLALARALLDQPDLLVLDEPANGLDPAGVVEIRELLRGLATEHGLTVFMSSHILGEVDRIATRIGIVHQGRLVEELDADALEEHRDRRLEIGAWDLEAARRTLLEAGFEPTLRAVEGQDRRLELRDPRALDAPDKIAAVLAASGVPPTHLAIARETLEDHFMRLTGGRAISS